MEHTTSNPIHSGDNGFFELIIESKSPGNTTKLQNLASLLFERLPQRDENSKIVLSHIDEHYTEISLPALRQITGRLFSTFHKKGIKRGDTVLLVNLDSTNEVFVATLFLALCCYGAKVFLPMYLEKELIYNWHSKVKFNFILLPEEEVSGLHDNERQQASIAHIKEFADENEIPCLDTFLDFQINALIADPPTAKDELEIQLIKSSLSNVVESDVALMITTSGTSGVSKIVFYDHRSFLLNISAWEKVGLFHPEALGGRGFTPMFSHTMGIRTFFNGLWLGSPVIIINTNWFKEKPEAVRFFLSQSKPEHITGGPAVFNLLLEMCRVFPELKSELRNSLKTIVSSGTAVNSEVLTKMSEAFDIRTHNAFGTTETQQVMNTIIKPAGFYADPASLGGMLPGVTIGLKKVGADNMYKLYLRSDYSGIRIIDTEGDHELRNKFIYLGDIVMYLNGGIYYLKREKDDYINDAFGVKIPLKRLKENYTDLYKHDCIVTIHPLKYTPGLSALIIYSDNAFQKQSESHKRIIAEIKNTIEKSNHTLYRQLEPLEFNHWTIKQFSVVYSDEIVNRKGIISEYKINKHFSTTITDLTEDNHSKSNIIDITAVEEKPCAYTLYHNSYVGKLLKCLEMDLSYSTARGDYLYANTNGKLKKVLDLTGGYGTNLLGHHNDELTNFAINYLKSGQIPLSDQLSIQKYPGLLSEKLNDMLGRHTGKSYYTLFGSTGSEAVEIAIHHAFLEWMKRIKKLEEAQSAQFACGREDRFREVWKKNWQNIRNTHPVIIANRTAFHGTSTGARSMMGDEERREKFRGLSNITSVFIDDRDVDLEGTIKKTLAENQIELTVFEERLGQVESCSYGISAIIAAIVEPIIGEGGIREVELKFPELLSIHDFPLIIDEIQCGLGRAGSFLASEGFKGNYYLFSKALGGNIAKISSISIEKEQFVEEIGKLYVSTFAGGGFAANIALENLKIIERLNVPQKAKILGEEIYRLLNPLQQKYPSVIEAIRGKGLMIGIKFSGEMIRRNLFFRVLHDKKALGYLFSSYLLFHYNLRVLPSISAPDVLRVEPSIGITPEDIMKLHDGLENLVQLIDKGQFYQLTRHLMKGDPYIDNKGKEPEYGLLPTEIDIPSEQSKKVAFIAHFAYPVDELRMLSKDFTAASDTGIRQLFSKFELIMEMEPFVLYAKNLFRQRIHLTMILIPLDSSELEKLHRTDKKHKVISKIQKAVQMAANGGAEIISLGGYTSILTNNGLSIAAPHGCKVVTGNTLTAVVGYHNFIQRLKKLYADRDDLKIGIVGATGNIGNILSQKLVNEECIRRGSLLTVGRNKEKTDILVKLLIDQTGYRGPAIHGSMNLNDLEECDAIIIAVNSNDPVLYPKHIRKNQPVLITDLSVPSGISEELRTLPNIQIVPFAASIKLPEDQDFLITSCSPRGTALCCTAEAFLMAFERQAYDFRENITLDGFNLIHDLAVKHGFIKNTGLLRSYKSTIEDAVSV